MLKFLGLILSIFSFQTFAQSTINNNALNSIPKIELEYLKRFFHAYFIEDDFSYTLFGDKPMSFSGIDNKASLCDLNFTYLNSSRLPMGHAFEVFKKWRHHFLNKNYFFICNEDKDGIFIYFINKKEFLNVINENIDIFLKEFGEEFSAGSFLEKIMEEKQSFLGIIQHHEGILGILLGYGRHNSMLFQRKADILGRCWAYDNEIKKDDGNTTRFFGFSSVDEELEYLNNKLDSFSEEHEYNTLIPLAPLGFASDNDHLETKKLKEKYQRNRIIINELFIKNDPLEIILCKLFSD